MVIYLNYTFFYPINSLVYHGFFSQKIAVFGQKIAVLYGIVYAYSQKLFTENHQNKVT
jgi:hypothetical protein